MASRGTYYLGRITTLGVLDKGKIINAIKNPIPIVTRGNAWSFIDTIEYNKGGNHFVFGRLSKYSPNAEVTVVDTEKKTAKKILEPNLILASSPFVYIPSHSGIAFLHVHNQIEVKTFISRFCSIILKTYHDFFVDCRIEPISDLKTFAIKLMKLEGIYGISARVYPPNPMFGHLWKSLKEYIDSRRSEKMRIQEESSNETPLNTDLPTHIQEIANHEGEELPIKKEIPIGDAAVLMAADGYGRGIVRGKRDGKMVIIKTSETIRNFIFDREPEPYDLYKIAIKIFEKVKEERHMEH